MASTQAYGSFSLASLSARARRLFSRASHSASTRNPKRSSKARLLISGLCCARAPPGVDEDPDALVEGKARHLGVLLLLAPRVGHGVELQVLQFLQGWGRQHGDVLLHR